MLAAAWAAGEVPSVMPAIYALYVINKSGGLIYNKVRLLSTRRRSPPYVRLLSTPASSAAGVCDNLQQQPERHTAPGQHLVRLVVAAKLLAAILSSSARAPGLLLWHLQALAPRYSSAARARARLHGHRAAARGHVRPALLPDADRYQVLGRCRAGHA